MSARWASGGHGLPPSPAPARDGGRNLPARHHCGAVGDFVAGVDDDFVVFGEAGEDFGGEAVAVADVEGLQSRFSVANGEDGPLVAVAEEGAGGDLQDGFV